MNGYAQGGSGQQHSSPGSTQSSASSSAGAGHRSHLQQNGHLPNGFTTPPSQQLQVSTL